MILDNVKNICRMRGIKLNYLAELLNVTSHTVYITLKNPNIKLSTICKIAKALNCTVVDIIAGMQPTMDVTKHNADSCSTFICPNCGQKLEVIISKNEGLKKG